MGESKSSRESTRSCASRSCPAPTEPRGSVAPPCECPSGMRGTRPLAAASSHPSDVPADPAVAAGCDPRLGSAPSSQRTAPRVAFGVQVQPDDVMHLRHAQWVPEPFERCVPTRLKRERPARCARQWPRSCRSWHPSSVGSSASLRMAATSALRPPRVRHRRLRSGAGHPDGARPAGLPNPCRVSACATCRQRPGWCRVPLTRSCHCDRLQLPLGLGLSGLRDETAAPVAVPEAQGAHGEVCALPGRARMAVDGVHAAEGADGQLCVGEGMISCES